MGRAISLSQLFGKRRKYLPLEGEWLARVGKPEVNCRWFIMAPTGSGKTTLIAMIAKELAKYGRVALDSAEEGDSASLMLALKRVGADKLRGRLIIYDCKDVASLDAFLSKQKSPNIVILDSIQFFEMTKKEYDALMTKYPEKTFVFVSHMEGKNPQGALAAHIWKDSGIKIVIEAFVAFIRSSRYGGNLKPVIIWEEAARKYHAIDLIQ